MTAGQLEKRKSNYWVRLWNSARPYSYPAAIVPVAISTAVSKLDFPALELHWLNITLLFIGCIGAQAISNFVNDLVDYKLGIDTAEGPGRKSGLLTGALSYKEMFFATVVISIISSAIGIYFTVLIGWPIFVIAVFGGLMAIEYTAPPLMLKYRALGDAAVFFSFGIAMVLGAYLVNSYPQVGVYSADNLVRLFVYNLPNILLVVGILQANNHRDREKDRKLGGLTVANKLAAGRSKQLLQALIIGPYILVILGILLKWLGWPSLLVVLTLPLTLRILGPMKHEDYSQSVPLTARLHGQFGFWMTLSVVIAILWR